MATEGGIIINLVVALKKSVRRCGCFQEPCSTPRARYVWWWEGGGGGVGRDNYKLCSCIEKECETLWLLPKHPQFFFKFRKLEIVINHTVLTN